MNSILSATFATVLKSPDADFYCTLVRNKIFTFMQWTEKILKFFTIFWNCTKFQKFVSSECSYMGRKCIKCSSICIYIPSIWKHQVFFPLWLHFYFFTLYYWNSRYLAGVWGPNGSLRQKLCSFIQKNKNAFFPQNIFSYFFFHNSNSPSMSINVIDNIDF